MFQRPIAISGWHAYLPVEKGVFRHNIVNWTATKCQNPLLRTYFLLNVKQEQFVLERSARLILDTLHPPNKRGVGSWCQKKQFYQFSRNFLPEIFFDPPKTSVTVGGGFMVSKKVISIADHFLKKFFWQKLEEDKEKFLRAGRPIKGNTKRPHGPKKKLQGF